MVAESGLCVGKLFLTVVRDEGVDVFGGDGKGGRGLILRYGTWIEV